jgi:hypothetical protein
VDKVAVQGLEDMVQEDFRDLMGMLQRIAQSLPELVDDRINDPMRPNQLFHSWRLMGVSNVIQGRLSYMHHQCIEGIWEQASWFLW